MGPGILVKQKSSCFYSTDSSSVSLEASLTLEFGLQATIYPMIHLVHSDKIQIIFFKSKGNVYSYQWSPNTILN